MAGLFLFPGIESFAKVLYKELEYANNLRYSFKN